MIFPVLLCIFLSCCYSLPIEEVVKEEYVPQLGAWQALPLNSKEVTSMAKFLQDAYNEKSYSLYWYKIKEVTEAFFQVVNGINYEITMIIEPTGCLKEEDLKTCVTPSLDGMKVEKCHFYVEEDLNNFTKVIIGKTCEEV